MNVTSMAPSHLHELAREGQIVELLDVRTPVEYRESHIGFARNVPLDRLDAPAMALGRETNGPMYVICRTGNRAQKAAEKLLSAGVSEVVNVAGGMQAWEQAGLPVVRGKKAMSLERQVRIVAGSLVVLGSALGVLVSPWWIGLAAFVGAGLVFAGVTDTCGMAMLLAKMPWNQVKESEPNSASARNDSTPTGNCLGSA